MTKLMFSIGVYRLDRIDNEEDLKPRSGIYINPPPLDGRCESCGRHIGELKPFGGPGDPLSGDFNGALLVKSYKPMISKDDEFEKIISEFSSSCLTGTEKGIAWELIEKRHGKEVAGDISYYLNLRGSIDSIWECRDCAILDT